MIKSEIEECELNEDIQYPCLMERKHDRGVTIVLMTSSEGDVGKGIAVYSYGSCVVTGDDWDMKLFKPFKGKLTMSNDFS